MDPERVAVHAVAAPAAFAAAVLFHHKLTKRGDDAGFAIAVGFAIAYLGLGGKWRLPPVQLQEALLPMAVLAGLLLLFGAAKAPMVIRSVVHVALAGVAVWFSVLDKSVLWLGGSMAGVVAFLWSMDVRAEATGPKSFLATTLVTAAATAAAIGLSGTAAIAEFAVALTAAAGGALVYSLKWPVTVRGAALITGILLPMLWLDGWILADLPLASMLLLAASPIASHVARRLAQKKAKPSALFAIELGASLVLCGAAAGIAYAKSPPFGSPY